MNISPQSIARFFLSKSKLWKENYLFIREFKHFPRIVLFALIFPFFAATFEGIGIGFLLAFLQSLTTPDSQPTQIGVAWIDTWILGVHLSSQSRLFRISALIFISSTIRSLFNYLTQVYTQYAGLRLVDRLRKRIFEQLASLDLAFFSSNKSGEFVNTLTSEMDRFRNAFRDSSFLVTRFVVLGIYLISMLLISWQLTLIAVVLFSLMFAGFTAFNRKIRSLSFQVSSTSGIFTSTAIEFINGIRTIRAFSSEEIERRKYYRASDDFVQSSIKTVRLWTLVRPLAEVISTAIVITIILIAFSGFIAQESLQVSAILVFLFVLSRLIPILQDINGQKAQLSSLKGAAENIKSLVNTQGKPYFRDGHRPFTVIRDHIQLHNVSFRYEEPPHDFLGDSISEASHDRAPQTVYALNGGSTPSSGTNSASKIGSPWVLNNINLVLSKGEMTALVGASGSGKSTLAHLLIRFHDVARGQITIDDVPIETFQIRSLRSRMAMVSQDTFIFNTSVRNNIAYGLECVDDAKIIQAARHAHALEFIKQMPEGFDTPLGDRGVRLSGGQRQRIAIARALLRNPDILILDEATSALDSVSEQQIQAAIDELSVGRTVIAIAHRLSTIMKADKVVVLDQGRILEEGTYQELLQQRGKLWEYHQMQHQVSVECP